ncbi:MAG TPA: DUF5058 family protein [Negativicutes bacterium]|nr:DUF5058 family protein [Negativicutes bacterium]
MDFLQTINGKGMWIASGIMVGIVVLQSIVFLLEALKEAKKIGVSQGQCIKAVRSAAITSIGPSFGPVIVLMALIPVLGAPTTWMRLCDIGAPATELAMATLSAKIINVDLRSAAYDIRAFSYSMWGMALNNLGWLLFSLLFTHRMSGGLQKLSEKSDPIWVKYLMSGAALGLFGYLLSEQMIVKNSFQVGNLYAGVIAGIAMIVLSKVGKKIPVIREPALGIAMAIGMIAAGVLA